MAEVKVGEVSANPTCVDMYGHSKAVEIFSSTHSLQGPHHTRIMVQVVLTMIVKNESSVIERCLDAIRDVVHGVSVLDTGSEDDTPDRIRAWCERHNKPCLVEVGPFVNFGVSRSRSLELARNAATLWEWSLDHTFSLLVDADMCVRWHGTADTLLNNLDSILGPPHVNGATLTQVNREVRYANLRFARASASWRCIGATHEYYGVDEGQDGNRDSVTVTISQTVMWIDDIGDGGCKSEKFIRDERLLREELVHQPDNPRTHFYLAQTLASLGKDDEAVRLYKKRATMGSFHEEAFMALIRAADICLTNHATDASRFDEGVGMLLRAMSMRPHRGEPSFLLASAYHKRDEHHLCTLFAIENLRCDAGGDILFVNHKANNKVEAIRLLGISAYYAGHMNVFRRACDVLTCAPDIPDHLKDLARRNARFGLQRAEVMFGATRSSCHITRMEDMGLRREDWDEVKQRGYRSCQTSVDSHVQEDGRVRALVRFVNYRVEERDDHELIWTPAAPPFGDGKTIRTRMGLGWLNLGTLQVEHVTLVHETASTGELFLPWQRSNEDDADLEESGCASGGWVRGLEDARIIPTHQGVGNKIQVFGSGCSNQNTGVPHLAKATLCTRGERVEVEESKPIPQPFNPARPEKNWMPCCSPDGSLLILYDANHAWATNMGGDGWVDPTEFELGPSHTPHHLNFDHRGGAACWLGGWGILCAVHEVIFLGDNHRRLYVHRFVMVDPFTMAVRKRTLPFRFVARHQVEFAMGILVSDGNVFVTFGSGDEETWTFTTPLSAVEANMYDIEQLKPKQRAHFVTGT